MYELFFCISTASQLQQQECDAMISVRSLLRTHIQLQPHIIIRFTKPSPFLKAKRNGYARRGRGDV